MKSHLLTAIALILSTTLSGCVTADKTPQNAPTVVSLQNQVQSTGENTNQNVNVTSPQSGHQTQNIQHPAAARATQSLTPYIGR